MSEYKYRIVEINEDNNFLHTPCQPVATKEEGEEIAKDLFWVLSDNGRGVGLAANQIGLDKRVCVVNVKEPLYFINPKITPVLEAGTFVYLETCLSMPGVVARTERWRSIIIEADNFEGKSAYDISNIPQDLVMQSTDAFEMAAIQHEIDHLDGFLMTDRQYNAKPLHTQQIPNRNDKIKIRKGSEIKQIKYKKLEEFEKLGWSMTNDLTEM
jgi:peptide deformylase